jgi:serine/threonine protein kinase
VDLPLPDELTALLPHGMYQVEGFLGQGGMGAVYKGLQVRLKRPVAIKIMRRDMGKDYDFEQRFEREAQAMAKLNHPNIVGVHDYGEAGPDYLYIVMELVDGADLMDVIRGGQMTQEMALTLLPQICDALQFAHDHGIVHRDIKPSNIMLTRDGRIKMADFGLAKRFDVESSFRTQTGTGMGTPDYAAPEQFDSAAQIDHRADIYALGVMIYQMITGQLPRGVWKPPSQRAEVDPCWDDIVAHAMQSDPKDRYQKASEIKTDVTKITPASRASVPDAKSESAKVPQPKPAQPSHRDGLHSAAKKSRAPLLFGIIVGTLVLAIGAFFAFRPAGDDVRSLTSMPGASVSEPKNNEQPRLVTSSPATASLPETGWQPLITSDETPPADGSWKREGGLLNVLVRAQKDMPSADGAVRATLQVREGMQGCSVITRADKAKGHYKLVLNDDLKKVMLRFFDEGSESTLLGNTRSRCH